MVRYYRVIAYTPYCGEEFTGYCCFNDENLTEVEKAHGFADVLITENAEEHFRDHVEDATNEEECEEYYEGCGAIWQEIDYKTYLEEAFEGDEEEFENE